MINFTKPKISISIVLKVYSSIMQVWSSLSKLVQLCASLLYFKKSMINHLRLYRILWYHLKRCAQIFLKVTCNSKQVSKEAKKVRMEISKGKGNFF